MALAVCLVLTSVGFVAPPTADEDPPSVPASYYGTVTIDGEPAPAGTVVSAVVDGEVIASIEVEDPGQYGGATIGDEKLAVPPPADRDDGTIAFLVNGEEGRTDPTSVEWETGDHRRVDLAVGPEARDPIPSPVPPPDPGEPDLQVTAAALSETTIEVGDSVTAEATIENLGEAEGSTTVSVAVDGETGASEEVFLDAGATATVSFDRTFDESGTYEVSVGGTTAGAVTVEEPPGDGEDRTDDGDDDSGDGGDGEDGSDDGVPGFGGLVTIVALTVASLLATRTE